MGLAASYLVGAGGTVVAGLGVRAVWLAVAVPCLLGHWAASERQGDRRRLLVRLAAAGLVAMVFVVVAFRLQRLARDIPAGGAVPTMAALAAGGLVGGMILGAALGRRLRGVEVILLEAGLAMVATDLAILRTPTLTDLIIDLRAGERWLAGLAVYEAIPITIPPGDHRFLPFLYPPFTLPFFALLASLPHLVTAAVWGGGTLLAGLAALRLFGIRWRWLPLFVLWPPFFQGLHSGNVVIPTLVVLALGPWVGALLPLGAVFKLQSGVPALWLLKERRWTAVAAGIGTILVLVAVTLPLVGPDRWREWLAGLAAFQRAPLSLIGYALPRYMPYPVYLAIAIAAIVLALTRSGRVGLAALAVASAVASPSLYDHGFLVLIPALLFLDARLLWLSLGLTSFLGGYGWWVLPPLAAAGLFSPRLRQDPALLSTLHPVEGSGGPWPGAPDV